MASTSRTMLSKSLAPSVPARKSVWLGKMYSNLWSGRDFWDSYYRFEFAARFFPKSASAEANVTVWITFEEDNHSTSNGCPWSSRGRYEVVLEGESPALPLYQAYLSQRRLESIARLSSCFRGQEVKVVCFEAAMLRELPKVLARALEEVPDFAAALQRASRESWSKQEREMFCAALKRHREKVRAALMECTPLYADVAGLVAGYVC